MKYPFIKDVLTMENIDLEDFRPLNEQITKTRAIIRELMDNHYKKFTHDEERKIIEMRYFLESFKFITKKWNVEILYELEIHEGLIFNDIMRHLDGISTRSLSDCLKQLEELGFITRTVQEQRPPTVFYQLSKKGKGFIELIQFIILYLIGI